MKAVFNDSEKRMEKAVDVLISEYSSIKAGRANPKMLEKITVDYYDTATPINQLAAVSVTEARTLTIQPWDVSIIDLIEKAIQMSDLGINPQSDGKVIRLVFPQLTEERRHEIVKEVSKFSEDSKVGIRSIRRDSIDKLKKMKKSSEITEDDLKNAEKRVQDLTDKYCKIIDDIAIKKEKEVMAV